MRRTPADGLRAALAAGCGLAVVVTTSVALASPAFATHEYCGKDAEGVHLGGYAGQTRDNGHPDGEGDGGYAGGAAVGTAKNVALRLERAAAFVSTSEGIYDVLAYREPNKELKLGFSIAGSAIGTAQLAADAAVLALEQRNAEVDACGSVMLGDMIDTLFVARMHEELAEFDPADGRIKVPTSMYLLPDDGSPQWTKFSEDSQRYSDRPGHDALDIPYVDGFANTEAVGVAAVVRNTIAHLDAHGMSTGGGTVWVPGEGLKTTPGAKALWWDAMHLLEDGRVRLAYAKFAEAYQVAVTAQGS